MHFLHKLIGELLQPPHAPLGQRWAFVRLFQRLQAEHESREVLPHLVVQLVGDAAALLLLRGHEPPPQLLTRLFRPLALRNFDLQDRVAFSQLRSALPDPALQFIMRLAQRLLVVLQLVHLLQVDAIRMVDEIEAEKGQGRDRAPKPRGQRRRHSHDRSPGHESRPRPEEVVAPHPERSLSLGQRHGNGDHAGIHGVVDQCAGEQRQHRHSRRRERGSSLQHLRSRDAHRQRPHGAAARQRGQSQVRRRESCLVNGVAARVQAGAQGAGECDQDPLLDAEIEQ